MTNDNGLGSDAWIADEPQPETLLIHPNDVEVGGITHDGQIFLVVDGQRKTATYDEAVALLALVSTMMGWRCYCRCSSCSTVGSKEPVDSTQGVGA